MKNRKILYYLPLIYVEDLIEFEHFKIRPYSEITESDSLLPKNIFDGQGSLIEVNGFVSGDDFCSEYDAKIFKVLEGVKFGYFFLSPSCLQDIKGFVSNESFECFRVIERNEDPSFEHKVNITNGMYTYSQSMKLYYEFRKSIGLNRIWLRPEDLSYGDMFVKLIDTPRQLSTMKLYNRCWGAYSIHSHQDKALLARASIESLLGSTEYSKKTYVDCFWNETIDLINKHAKSSNVLVEIYKCLIPNQDEIKKNFESHIQDLRTARDKLVHDGEEDHRYINVPFYLIWFPLFWLVSLNSPMITEKEAIRLALFLWLMNFDVDKWQHIDFSPTEGIGLGIQRTYLDSYANNSRALPFHIEKNNTDMIEGLISSIISRLAEC